MNFDQLANLIKAGFNEEQIKNIGSIMGTGTSTNTGTNTNTPTPAPTTTALPTPTVTPAPTSTPATTPASAPASTPGDTDKGGTDKAGESETVTLLKEMLGIIQKGNINTVGTGAASQETGVDVLAEILNPTPKTK